ncbi:Uncharacterised protein [Nocardia farcinica]|nr:Uncharacterised protein [Nocardia farcinica]
MRPQRRQRFPEICMGRLRRIATRARRVDRMSTGRLRRILGTDYAVIESGARPRPAEAATTRAATHQPTSAGRTNSR